MPPLGCFSGPLIPPTWPGHSSIAGPLFASKANNHFLSPSLFHTGKMQTHYPPLPPPLCFCCTGFIKSYASLNSFFVLFCSLSALCHQCEINQYFHCEANVMDHQGLAQLWLSQGEVRWPVTACSSSHSPAKMQIRLSLLSFPPQSITCLPS